ncbi:MAG: hypothetical protein ACJ8BF_12800 [Gemmatimonadales bacterium]
MRTCANLARMVLVAVSILPSRLLAQSVVIAPRDPSITVPTVCQAFAATFTNVKGIVRPAIFAWNVTNTAAFAADTTGRVCLRATTVAAPTTTGVIAQMVGRSLRDSTSLTVLPPQPSAEVVMAQPRPGMIYERQRPTLTVADTQPTATARLETATIVRPALGDIARRYLPPGAAPTGISASSGSPVSATIYWTATSGVTGYTVMRSTSAAGHFDVVGSPPANATSFTDTGLAPLTTYYWTVSANYSGFSPGSSAAVSAATTAPKNPTDFTARAGQADELIMNWSPRSDAEYYTAEVNGLQPAQFTINKPPLSVSPVPPGLRSISLVAYYLGAGNQYYADVANPSRAQAAAMPKNGFPWLAKHGAGSTAEAGEYYSTIGATPGKSDLIKWKAANGFPAQGAANDEVRAQYFNAQDLNLGRDTHCRMTTNGHLACYQNNSGPIPGTPDFPNAQSALNDMVTGKAPFATVAMDQEVNGNVNFYAYKDDGALVNAVVLDNEGSKAMPNVCTACHGGRYDASSNTTSGASFLPFDVFGFTYASASGFTLADQQENFRKLNAMVKSTGPNASNPDNPIVTFIDGMYGNAVLTPGTHASDQWVPAGWSAKPNVYDVFKRTCRTCHLASNQTFDFMTYRALADFQGIIRSDVCTGKTMPHAEVPYRKFWTQSTVYLPFYWSDPTTMNITPCP